LVDTVDLPGETPDAFVVVANDLGQHALWQADLDLPPGWRPRSPVMSRSECLTAVEAAWPDVTPASARLPNGTDSPDRGHGPGRADGADGSRFVHELVAEQAARRPGATAVMAGRTRVTYRELDESASRLARRLAATGVGPETVVGVHLERGVDLIRAVLAIMKAGGGYLPLDPSLPAERLTRVCAQVNPVTVITAEASSFPVSGPRLLPLGEPAADPADRTAPAPAPAPGPGPDGPRPHPDHLCYVIFTSGSTGDPKAVAVSFGSLARVIGELGREYQISEHDRVAQVAAMAFDTSLEQVFTALTGGATLVLPPPGTVAPAELLRGIERKRVTVIDLTPAYWHQVLAHTTASDERLRSVRLMITGGEMADPADCRAALRAAPWARMLNAYGLTETTITSTVCDVGAWLAAADPRAAVPAGRPVGDTGIMILDGGLHPVPPGTGGEIYIGGHGVARGYLGRPALTAERFLPDASGVPGGRMYRTGDLGRWLPDGRLEIAGRIDRQLKVRGFRVEPGEIESALAQHPDIGQVAVTATKRGSGDTRLVAYYVPRDAAAPGAAPRHPSAASLRRYLADRLPGYMIPAAFIVRYRLPDGLADTALADTGLADTGLADTALADTGLADGGPAVDAQPPPARTDLPERGEERHTPVQAELSALWARLLGCGRVSLDDDFFALGGNSLLAAEMMAHTRALLGIPADSVQPLTRRLLRDPTLRAFAAAAAEASAGRLSAEGDPNETDFAAEARLDVSIRRDAAASLPAREQPGPREVLLTGATGFLGAHLLSELVAATGARVHCLVRARDEAAALSRIEAAAARYELPAPPAGRVTALAGDLAAPQLGLSAAAFRDLAQRIDVVYHPGALVNFIYPYEELRAANVTGTRELIRLAGLSRGIPLHFVSTTAVLAGLGLAGTREVTEETPLAHPELLRMGYVETKYVAEELLRNAGRAGLPVAIYRPLDIVGSLRTGAWSTSTEMCALVRFMADTGLAPDIDLPLDFVAADACAAAIRHISLSEGATGRTYHLASPESAPLAALSGRLRMRGYRITEIPYDDWVQELARWAARDPSHPMAAFLPLFVNRGADGLTVAEMYFRHVFPSYTRTNTERALAGSGIAFPAVSGRLLDRNIDRLMRTGYLPAPWARHRPAHVA
jgi:amino acid adenylation domain-containing protein/thioester reductase-like protein